VYYLSFSGQGQHGGASIVSTTHLLLLPLLVLLPPPAFTMGRIIDSVNATYARGDTTISLEFFPAKTEEGVSNLLSRIEVSCQSRVATDLAIVEHDDKNL